MIPELGHVALILSFCCASLLAIIPLVGTGQFSAKWRSTLLMSSADKLSMLVFFFLTFAMATLAYAFWMDDFSVIYVANNSNLELPHRYKISALWSAHEGSLLLWVWLLSLWMLAVVLLAKHLPLAMKARVLSVMGMVACGFLAFMIFTSNPFLRHLPFSPGDGSDLNPLLQDFGLIIHPPTLYLGYVGFSVAFAFAIAALLEGRVDAQWIRWTRPWALSAWIFLTLGIALGSWWAYYELGWGGWWFWDPVENASFMPWLTGTALLHSLAVSEKRGVFKSWTLLLAIFAFSLSLLGTFLVRSGVLTSVHAFASDPERGYFILAFLVLVIGASLTLYAVRAEKLQSDISFSVVSRETALLLNNVILIIVMLIVLLGTLYPLVADALNWGKISVGPPYFNYFFIPLMALLIFLMPIGSTLKWKQDSLSPRRHFLVITGVVCLLLAGVFSFAYEGRLNWQTLLSVAVVLWLWVLTLFDIRHHSRHSPSLWQGLVKLSRSYKGMVIAHLGIGVTAAGICLTSIYTESKDVRMESGVPVSLSGIEFVFDEIKLVRGQNYMAQVAEVKVSRDGEWIKTLHTEKRAYNSNRGNMMTEAGIDAGFFADIYVSMGEPIDKQNPEGAWAMRLHHKPFVRWIWLGALLMALGAAFSLSDRRYRVSVSGPLDEKD